MAIYQKIYLVVHPMLSPKIWGLSGLFLIVLNVNIFILGANLPFEGPDSFIWG